MRVIYLTTVLPSKRQTGGEIVSQSIIDALEYGGHEVVVLGYRRKNDLYIHKSNEVPVGERYIETAKAKFYPLVWMGVSWVSKLPYSSAKYYSENYIEKVQQLITQENYDVVIIDHAQVGWLEKLIPDKSKIIFHAQNIEHQVYLDNCKNSNNALSKRVYEREAKLIKQMEDDLAHRAQQVWTLATDDYNYFSHLKQNGKVRFFTTASHVEIPDEPPPDKNCDVGMIGTWTWQANLTGLQWFFNHVYPHLPPDVSINVAGKGAEWLTQKYTNVKYCGFVPNAQQFMSQAKVVAIPSISGSGLQIKTLDAIACGSMVVATPFALRGIAEYPASVKVAKQPQAFARSLTELLKSPQEIDLCQNAIAWSKNRRTQFIEDITDAINTFGLTTQSSKLLNS